MLDTTLLAPSTSFDLPPGLRSQTVSYTSHLSPISHKAEMAPNKYNDIVLNIVGQIGIIKARQSTSIKPIITNKNPSSTDPNHLMLSVESSSKRPSPPSETSMTTPTQSSPYSRAKAGSSALARMSNVRSLDRQPELCSILTRQPLAGRHQSYMPTSPRRRSGTCNASLP